MSEIQLTRVMFMEDPRIREPAGSLTVRSDLSALQVVMLEERINLRVIRA